MPHEPRPVAYQVPCPTLVPARKLFPPPFPPLGASETGEADGAGEDAAGEDAAGEDAAGEDEGTATAEDDTAEGAPQRLA